MTSSVTALFSVCLAAMVVMTSLQMMAANQNEAAIVAAPDSDCPNQCECTLAVTSSSATSLQPRLAATSPSAGAAAAVHLTCSSNNNDTVLPHLRNGHVTAGEFSGFKITTLTSQHVRFHANVTTLKLIGCGIETLANQTFTRLIGLTSLSLQGNALATIHPQTFHGCEGSLQTLDLSENLLDQLDGNLSTGLRSLSRLDLHANRLTALKRSSFDGLINLKYLILSNNRIEHIDRKAFTSLTKLAYLVLRGNPLNGYLQLHFATTSLSYLDASECGLLGVPHGLVDSLRYLQLRRNSIKHIRLGDFESVPHLSILVLDENGLVEINHGTLEPLRELQQLWLNANGLLQIPQPLPASLQRLLLDGNLIESVAPASFPVQSQLSTLSLVANNITSLSPDAFHKLTSLKHLDLSNNRIEILRARTFARNNHLQTLLLANNPFRHLHNNCFKELPALQTLSLAYVPETAKLHSKAFARQSPLQKLDLNSSPSLALDVLRNMDIRQSLSLLRELNLLNTDLTGLTLVEISENGYPNLEVLRLTSSNWHCDVTQVPFADWLETTTLIPDEDKENIVCLTPKLLYSLKLLELKRDQYAPVTTLPTASVSSNEFFTNDFNRDIDDERSVFDYNEYDYNDKQGLDKGGHNNSLVTVDRQQPLEVLNLNTTALRKNDADVVDYDGDLRDLHEALAVDIKSEDLLAALNGRTTTLPSLTSVQVKPTSNAETHPYKGRTQHHNSRKKLPLHEVAAATGSPRLSESLGLSGSSEPSGSATSSQSRGSTDVEQRGGKVRLASNNNTLGVVVAGAKNVDSDVIWDNVYVISALILVSAVIFIALTIGIAIALRRSTGAILSIKRNKRETESKSSTATNSSSSTVTDNGHSRYSAVREFTKSVQEHNVGQTIFENINNNNSKQRDTPKKKTNAKNHQSLNFTSTNNNNNHNGAVAKENFDLMYGGTSLRADLDFEKHKFNHKLTSTANTKTKIVHGNGLSGTVRPKNADNSQKLLKTTTKVNNSTTRQKPRRAVYFECDLDENMSRMRSDSSSNRQCTLSVDENGLFYGYGSNSSSHVSEVGGLPDMPFMFGRDAYHEGPLRVYKWEDF